MPATYAERAHHLRQLVLTHALRARRAARSGAGTDAIDALADAVDDLAELIAMSICAADDARVAAERERG